MEEKKKKVRRPEILSHAYADRIYDEIKTIAMCCRRNMWQ